MTTVRPVLTTADIDTYLAVRDRVHPETPMPREWVLVSNAPSRTTST